MTYTTTALPGSRRATCSAIICDRRATSGRASRAAANSATGMANSDLRVAMNGAPQSADLLRCSSLALSGLGAHAIRHLKLLPCTGQLFDWASKRGWFSPTSAAMVHKSMGNESSCEDYVKEIAELLQ